MWNPGIHERDCFGGLGCMGINGVPLVITMLCYCCVSIDTECKLVGEAVANIAWAVACHQLKVLCHVGDGPSKKRSSGW